MGAALNEFEARLDEASSAAHFMNRAYRLRPRIGSSIRWDGPQQEVELLRSFMVEDTSREAEILAALLVRTVAAFERYIRKCCIEFVDKRAELASTARSLASDLKQRNLILSAKLLSSLDQPRDHISFSPATIVERLAACEKNSIPYELNGVSFTAFLQSPTVETLDKVFGSIGLKDLFERLGRSTPLQLLCETSGTRATSTRVKERITEIIRLRNNFAHAGDDERTLNIQKLDEMISFLRTVASDIDRAISDRISQGFE
jgi:hypothetical protein